MLWKQNGRRWDKLAQKCYFGNYNMTGDLGLGAKMDLVPVSGQGSLSHLDSTSSFGKFNQTGGIEVTLEADEVHFRGCTCKQCR